MLTGDAKETAERVAQELGIDDYRAELLPEEKFEVINTLKSEGHRVVMVGDGVNDAPSLGIADVGVAMGVAGTDIALETADVALMSDSLMRIPEMLRLSKRTRRIILQNIFAAIGIKLIFVILALTGFVTLWMAVAADMGVSLLVITNGLRLLRQ